MTKSYNRITPDDILEVSDVYTAGFYNDGAFARVIESDPSVLHDGRKLGWSDAEVRDRVTTVSQKLKIDLQKYL